MELSDALIQNAVGFASGLVGAVVGGLFTLYATNKVISEENAKEDRQEEKQVQNLLAALGVEINALWSFHMRRVGVRVEALPEGEALEFDYPITQDYFTIYHQNAAQIGNVKDADLRERIVVTYNKCKKVVDGFKHNNTLYQDYKHLLLMPDSPVTQAQRATKRTEMVEYAKLIKEDHDELKGYVDGLLTGLAKVEHSA